MWGSSFVLTLTESTVLQHFPIQLNSRRLRIQGYLVWIWIKKKKNAATSTLFLRCCPAQQLRADWWNFPEIWVWRAEIVIQPLLSSLFYPLSAPSAPQALWRFKWACAVQWRMLHSPLSLPILLLFIRRKPIKWWTWKGRLCYAVPRLTVAAFAD